MDGGYTARSFAQVTEPELKDRQLVRGSTLETAHRHFPKVIGAAEWARHVATLPPATRELLQDVDMNEWYPESQLRHVIYMLHDGVAGGDQARFLELVRGMTLAGINRFFRLLINLSSGTFVLRKIPVMWERFRRGPATVEAEVAEDGRVLLHYENYAYAGDPVYRLLSVGNVQAIVYAATKKLPEWQVVAYDATSMTLAFRVPD